MDNLSKSDETFWETGRRPARAWLGICQLHLEDKLTLSVLGRALDSHSLWISGIFYKYCIQLSLITDSLPVWLSANPVIFNDHSADTIMSNVFAPSYLFYFIYLKHNVHILSCVYVTNIFRCVFIHFLIMWEEHRPFHVCFC